MLRRNGSQCSLCFFGQCCGVSATSECQMLFSVPCRKHGENLAQSLADVLQIRTRSGGEWKWRLLLIAFTLQLQELTGTRDGERSEEHTSELQSPCNLVCRLLLEKKKKKNTVEHLLCHRIPDL